jgi:hypothetical protein
VGDKKYGAKGNPIRRLGLHAFALSFIHPVSGKRISLESPIPKAFIDLAKSDYSAYKFFLFAFLLALRLIAFIVGNRRPKIICERGKRGVSYSPWDEVVFWFWIAFETEE